MHPPVREEGQMAANRIDIVRRNLEAFARGDWDAFRRDLTDDAVYEEEGTQRRLEGIDRYLEVVKAWKAAFPDLQATLKETVASGDAVVAELEWAGTHTGELRGPMGALPPTNRFVKVPAVLLSRFEGDKV